MKISEQKLRKVIRQVILEEYQTKENIPNIKITQPRSLFLSACAALAILGLSSAINHENPQKTIRAAHQAVSNERTSKAGQEFRKQFPEDYAAIMLKQGRNLDLNVDDTPTGINDPGTEMVILNQHYKRKGRRV